MPLDQIQPSIVVEDRLMMVFCAEIEVQRGEEPKGRFSSIGGILVWCLLYNGDHL